MSPPAFQLVFKSLKAKRAASPRRSGHPISELPSPKSGRPTMDFSRFPLALAFMLHNVPIQLVGANMSIPLTLLDEFHGSDKFSIVVAGRWNCNLTVENSYIPETGLASRGIRLSMPFITNLRRLYSCLCILSALKLRKKRLWDSQTLADHDTEKW